MRSVAVQIGVCFVLAQVCTAAADELPPVDVALVLVSDVSRSIDDREFAMQKAGYTAAFTSENVVAAIRGGRHGAIAVAYVEFASAGDVRLVLDWSVVDSADSARALAERISAAPRSFYGRTAIGDGIGLAMQTLAAGQFGDPSHGGARAVIDVCGDGTNNAGRDVAEARDAAVAAGITVNGLTIINDHPVSYMFAHVQPPGGLTKYYREHVIGGPGSFVLEVHDFASFGQAMTRKLVNEIASVTPGDDRGRAAPPRG